MSKIDAIPYKIYLTEDEMPKAWYNVRSAMKTKPAPLLNPGTGKPMQAEELAPVFCEELIKQDGMYRKIHNIQTQIEDELESELNHE